MKLTSEQKRHRKTVVFDNEIKIVGYYRSHLLKKFFIYFKIENFKWILG